MGDCPENPPGDLFCSERRWNGNSIEKSRRAVIYILLLYIMPYGNNHIRFFKYFPAEHGIKLRLSPTFVRADEMLTAFVELQRAIHEFAVSLVL
jgi:hypothetical protein